MPRWPGAGFSPPSAVTRPQRVNVVPHTHWDREWYRPFQTFRLRARGAARRPARDLDGRPALAHFLLDGQMAVVDDYLERAARAARPAAAHLAAAGPARDGPLVHAARRVPRLGRDPRARPRARAATGPTSSAGAHGRRLPARHVRPHGPDAAAAAPGPASTTPWCGAACPALSTGPAFWWEAPDGTTVRAEYLPDRLRQRRPHAGGPGAFLARLDACGRARRGPRRRRPDPADERHRPPPPPARSAAAARRRDRGECGARSTCA